MTLAIVFPGQGSQTPGMFRSLAKELAVRRVFAEASDILGRDFWHLATDADAEAIGATEVTQPLMLTAGYALYCAWRERSDDVVAFMAGHSLGEYTALVAAQSLTFADALPLVAFRAQVMQAAVPAGTGAMAAVLGLDRRAVEDVCAEAREGHVLEAVNYNSPEQTVIAGDASAVARGIEAAKAAGAKRVVPLAVSVPSHCALMRPAAEAFSRHLATVPFAPPRTPVIHNADVRMHVSADDVRNVLAEQLYRPVRWVETIQYIAAQDVSCIVEIGPGKVLTGLNKRVAPSLTLISINDLTTLEEAVA